MRNPLMGASLLPALLLAAMTSATTASTAHAQSNLTRIEGKVVQSRSRWGYQHSAIVTESLIEDASGRRTWVHQLGGSVDGVGMRLSHSPLPLGLGDEVRLQTRLGHAASGKAIRQLVEIESLLPANGAGVSSKDANRRDFVRTRNDAGAAIYWASGCVYLGTAQEGAAQVDRELEFNVVGEVLSHWQEQTASCSEFYFEYEGAIDAEVGLDGVNVIKFREDEWCRPASDDDPGECYDEAAAGLTTLFFIDDEDSDRNGEIVDADIELNGVQFAIAVNGESGGAAQCQADLGNTLTHEVGHLLGIDHTCWAGGPRFPDNQGELAKSCNAPLLSDEIVEATMYNFQACGETKKTSLEDDDIAAMCSIYPTGGHSTSCKRAEFKAKGCCSVAGGTSEPGKELWLIALGFLAMLGLRRNRA